MPVDLDVVVDVDRTSSSVYSERREIPSPAGMQSRTADFPPTLLRENDLCLARVSVAIGRNKTYLQQYLRRGMPAALAFQDTETLGRLPGCHPSELRHETPPARAPTPRTRRHSPRRSSHVAIPEITVNTRADASTIAEAYADPAGVRNLKAEDDAMAPELQSGDRHRRRHVPPLADARGALRHVGRQLDRHQALRVHLGFRAAYDQAPLRRPLPPTLRLPRIRGPIPGQGVVGHTRSVTCDPACAPRPRAPLHP